MWSCYEGPNCVLRVYFSCKVLTWQSMGINSLLPLLDIRGTAVFGGWVFALFFSFGDWSSIKCFISAVFKQIRKQETSTVWTELLEWLKTRPIGGNILHVIHLWSYLQSEIMFLFKFSHRSLDVSCEEYKSKKMMSSASLAWARRTCELCEITAMFPGRCSVWRWPLSSSSDHHQPSFLSFHFSDTLFGVFSHFCLAAYLQFSSKLENIQHHLHNFTPHQHLLTPWWFASSSLQKCRLWFTTLLIILNWSAL